MAWQFERKGVVMLPAGGIAEDDVMLTAADAGAEDVVEEGEYWRVTTDAADLAVVRDGAGGCGAADRVGRADHGAEVPPSSSTRTPRASCCA